MGNYTTQLASSFFKEFDDYFLWNTSDYPELREAYSRSFQTDGIDGFYNVLINSRRQGSFPNSFVSYFESRLDSTKFIAEKQVELLDKYFQGDKEDEQKAFIDFGQGILYDENRRNNAYNSGGQYYVVHTMDSGYNPQGYNPPVGYHRWYGFIRIYSLLDENSASRWLEIGRNVTLAWVIQSELKPVGTTANGNDPENPAMEQSRIDELIAKISQMQFEDLDTVFEGKPYPNF